MSFPHSFQEQGKAQKHTTMVKYWIQRKTYIDPTSVTGVEFQCHTRVRRSPVHSFGRCHNGRRFARSRRPVQQQVRQVARVNLFGQNGNNVVLGYQIFQSTDTSDKDEMIIFNLRQASRVSKASISTRKSYLCGRYFSTHGSCALLSLLLRLGWDFLVGGCEEESASVKVAELSL